ncbi:MAG TPA: hypothetical protein VF381_01320 [Thermoanaerobaculia bacterium]
MRKPVVLATALLLAIAVVPARAEDDTATALLKSAGAKGGEVAAKWLAGLLYDTSCKDMNSDQVTGYVCVVLSGGSGRGEEEWKNNVTKKLEDIHKEVKTISENQTQLANTLANLKTDLNTKFKAIAQNDVAVRHLVSVEGLWDKFESQFDNDERDVTPEEMVSFAREIMEKKPQSVLDELNAVLTKPIVATGNQPLIRYPFTEWRDAHNRGMSWEHDMMDAYDYAEKRFVDYRLREEKAYTMYLWAASVLATNCKLHPGQCVQPPRPIDGKTGIREDWKRYTQQQAIAFNSAVDGLLLSYGPSRITTNGAVLPEKGARAVLLRANYLTSTILGSGKGLWGTVISMGNAWDGAVNVSCGPNTIALAPALKYSVPVEGSGVYSVTAPDAGPVDWWVSSAGNDVYDEAHFSNEWQVYHYEFSLATEGPCRLEKALPGGGRLPWVYPPTPVMTVRVPDRDPFPFGDFAGVQRAGGTYALVSGGWHAPREPERERSGKGTRAKVEQSHLIELNQPTGPWIGLFEKGRAEYTAALSALTSRIRNLDRIYVQSDKQIRFPEDSTFKLNFGPSGCTGFDICSRGKSILQYDIENNDTESKKGWLKARAAIFFTGAAPNAMGVVVDRSYDKTGDRKTVDVDGSQIGNVLVDTTKSYPLAYEIYFEMETEGRFTNASEYMYRALIAPGSVYLTKR